MSHHSYISSILLFYIIIYFLECSTAANIPAATNTHEPYKSSPVKVEIVTDHVSKLAPAKTINSPHASVRFQMAPAEAGETTTEAPLPPLTCESAAGLKPIFSQSIYQTSLPSWPLAGTTVHLGISAHSLDNAPIRYVLENPYDFITLTNTNDLIFTSNVDSGAYIGPNNVMILEVMAQITTDLNRNSKATIVIIFPMYYGEEEAKEDSQASSHHHD